MKTKLKHKHVKENNKIKKTTTTTAQHCLKYLALKESFIQLRWH